MAEIPFLGGPWGLGQVGPAAPSRTAPSAQKGTAAGAAKTPMDAWVDHVGTWNDVLRKHGSREGMPTGGELFEDWKRLVESWLNIWTGLAPWSWGLPGWPGSRSESVPSVVFLPDAEAECCDPRVIAVPAWIEESKIGATQPTRLATDEPVEAFRVTLNLVEPGQLAIGLEDVFQAPPGDYVSYVYSVEGPFRTPLAIAMISKAEPVASGG